MHGLRAVLRVVYLDHNQGRENMNEDVKALWLTALRSGEYQQTTGTLQNSEGFCCLGVLCDLAVKQGVEVSVTKAEYTSAYIYGGCMSTLPRSVREWAGMDDSGSLVDVIEVAEYEHDEEVDVEYAYSLIDLNDGAGYNFSQIADVIEEQF